MSEQQEDSSELSRNPSTGKPRQQRGTSLDLKFQEIMHMLYNLMSRMATPKWKDAIDLEIKCSRIIEKLHMERQNHKSTQRTPRD